MGIRMTTEARLPLLLLGAGGHAKVLLALLTALGQQVSGICDPVLARQNAKEWRGVPVLGDDDALAAVDPTSVGLVNGIGQTVGGTARRQLHERFKAMGFHFPSLVHPAAWVAAEARLADGVQVMAGAVVQPDCEISENVIINTCAGIDHDVLIGAHAHIAPGASVCGGAIVGAGAFVAAGATVIQGITVGEGAVVGAGVALVRNLPANEILLGAPGRPGRPL